MIKIINLTKSFGGHKVLDGINLTMPTGQITVVIGKSGVGKSVLLKHIIGLLKPDSGQIFVDGQDMSLLTGRQLREFKRRFAVLFQGGALFDSLNVFENIAFPLREKTRLTGSRDRQAGSGTPGPDASYFRGGNQVSRRTERRHEKAGGPGPGHDSGAGDHVL